MSRLNSWIDKVARQDRGLAALLRGIMTIQKEDSTLRFIWRSTFHCTMGREREQQIREHLGALQDFQICHIPLEEYDDPMVQEGLRLGARIKFLEVK